jgi:hypothetical protein
MGEDDYIDSYWESLHEIPDDYDNDDNGDDDPNDLDESMDGDHDSAMRDAGFGTDEDYGYYGGNDDE